MKILVVDVGGTQVKVLASGQQQPRKFDSGPTLTPEQLVRQVKALTTDWGFDSISIGFPGPVVHNRIVQEPHNLGPGWIGFDFAQVFGFPVQMINDAAMQALGSYRGGSMLFLGLGTGLGSALIVDGRVEALELAHLPYRDGNSYEDFVGMRGLQRIGEAEWRRHVGDVVQRLAAALRADDVVIGGGNAARLAQPLPGGARLGDNANAFLGGFALWETSRKPAVPNVVRSLEVLRAASRKDVAVLVDVDNTLIDNDRIKDDLERYLEREVGIDPARQYFEIFRALRDELGYADYLGALQRFRVEYPHEPGVLAVSSFLVNYPFANRLFPGALDALGYLDRVGPTVIFTDGDVVFQPRKIERSGLADAVGGRVLVYVHKERELEAASLRFPADHYLMIDDKVRMLSAVKEQWGARVTTIFVRQGHYASDPRVADYPRPDVSVARIGDLCDCDPEQLVLAGSVGDARRE